MRKPHNTIYIMKHLQTGEILPVWRDVFRRDKLHLQGWRLFRQTDKDEGTKFLKQYWNSDDFFRQHIEPFTSVERAHSVDGHLSMSAINRRHQTTIRKWETYASISYHIGITRVWGEDLAYLTRLEFGHQMVALAVWWRYLL